MSFGALAAVSKMRLGSAAEKLIALAYADRHNEETGCAYPSLAWLCEFSSLNRKTVIAAVLRLEAAGFLSDTGNRQGSTRQIKVYRLHLETVPKAEQYQKRNSTGNGVKQSQKRDTDTIRTCSSKATPSQKKRVRKSDAPSFILPIHIPTAEWEGFEEMRRRIGKPMTDKARSLAISRLDKLAEAGWPPGDVLNHSILNNYQGLFPPKDDRNGRNGQSDSRGSRPNPALDMWLSATGSRTRNEEDHFGTRLALPSG